MADDRTAPLAEATGFDWDAGNALKVVDRHAVGPGECEQAFFCEPFVVSYDPGHSALERRWRALGQTAAGRALPGPAPIVHGYFRTAPGYAPHGAQAARQ